MTDFRAAHSLDSLIDTILQGIILLSVEGVVIDYFEALKNHSRADDAMIEALDAFDWEKAGVGVEDGISKNLLQSPELRAGLREILETAIIECGSCDAEINFPRQGAVMLRERSITS